MIWLTAAFMMLSWAPMPTPQSRMPTAISSGSPVRKTKPAKKALHAVETIRAFSPTRSNSQPKKRAAKASTAIAPA